MMTLENGNLIFSERVQLPLVAEMIESFPSIFDKRPGKQNPIFQGNLLIIFCLVIVQNFTIRKLNDDEKQKGEKDEDNCEYTEVIYHRSGSIKGRKVEVLCYILHTKVIWF